MPDRMIRGRRFVVIPLPATQSFALQPLILPIAGEIGRIVMAALDAKAGVVEQVKKAITDPESGEIDLDKLSIERFLELDIDMAQAGDMLALAAARVAATLPPRDLEFMLRRLLRGATCEGKVLFKDETAAPQYFDVAMAGQTIATWELLFFAVQVNYPDLFSLGTSAPDAPAVPESH